MTSDELRKAAELAEIRWLEIDDGVWRFVYEIAPSHYWYWYAEDPALPAFVASLLVAKVRDAGGYIKMMYELDYLGADGDTAGVATDEQRIRAAVAALGKGESE